MNPSGVLSSRPLDAIRDASATASTCGYYHWTAMDNFEWTLGYAPKFGIIAVDRATQRRTVKSTGEWLGRVARANSTETAG